MSGLERLGDRLVPAMLGVVTGATELEPILELSALEYAWSRERDDGGLAVWMVTCSIERNGIALERLRPADELASVTPNGDPHATAEHSAMGRASGSDAPATHRPHGRDV